MAPEVIRQEDYNTSADVYSFGILGHCILCAEEYAYRDRYLTPIQAAMGVAKHNLRPRVNEALPKTIQTILAMCWAPKADDRPPIEIVISMLAKVRQKLQQEKEKKHDEKNSTMYAWLWGSSPESA